VWRWRLEEARIKARRIRELEGSRIMEEIAIQEIMVKPSALKS